MTQDCTLYRRRNRKAHWIPPNTRRSPCGQLDLDWHRAERVSAVEPGDVCRACAAAMRRSDLEPKPGFKICANPACRRPWLTARGRPARAVEGHGKSTCYCMAEPYGLRFWIDAGEEAPA